MAVSICSIKASRDTPHDGPTQFLSWALSVSTWKVNYWSEVGSIRYGLTPLLVALNVFKDTDSSSSEWFYKCDKCHKVPKRNDNDGGNLPWMLIGKDPYHPHWGVVCKVCQIHNIWMIRSDLTWFVTWQFRLLTLRYCSVGFHVGFQSFFISLCSSYF